MQILNPVPVPLVSPKNDPVEDGSVILSDEELLKRSNRKGILKDVPIENPLEKRILSGFRLPEDDNDPYFRGLRGSEISDMRRMQRQVLGEEEINPNVEEGAKAFAKGIETTEFRLKKKLMKAIYGIEILVTKKNKRKK